MMRTHRARRLAAAGPARFEAIEPRLLLDGLAAAHAGPDGAVHVLEFELKDLVVTVLDPNGTGEATSYASWIAEDGAVDLHAAAWTDPETGSVWYAVSSPEGLTLVLHDDDRGREAVRPLTFQIRTTDGPGAAEPIASNITAFVSTDGRAHIAGLTASGDLVLYRQTNRRTPLNERTWEFVNISEESLAPRGIATPTFASDLTSYVTPWNGLNIAGLDPDGNVTSVWWAPGLGDVGEEDWQVSNLTAITGAPPILGNVTVYQTAWQGINIAGVNAAGEIVVAWWVPQFGGDWEVTNFTQAFGGPEGGFQHGSVFAYTTPWGGLNVGGLPASEEGASAGGPAMYWWVPEFEGQWLLAENLAPGGEQLADGIIAVTSPSGDVSLIGGDGANSVYRLGWSPSAPESGWSVDVVQDSSPGSAIDEFGGSDAGPTGASTLAGTWSVSITGAGALSYLGEDRPGLEDGFIDDSGYALLNRDGTLSIELAFGADDLTSGTWTLESRELVIDLRAVGPDFEDPMTLVVFDAVHIEGSDVFGGTRTFTTTGITLTPEARTRLETAIDAFEDSFAFPDTTLREAIEADGGVDAILARIRITWFRL